MCECEDGDKRARREREREREGQRKKVARVRGLYKGKMDACDDY